MTNEEYELLNNYPRLMEAKRTLLSLSHLLTDEDLSDTVNTLITFQNSHIVANSFKDDQVAYALADELEAALIR